MENQENTKPDKPAVKGCFRILWRFVRYFFLLCFVLLLSLAGISCWLFGSESGQAWLVKTANNALALPPGGEGVGIRLTSLSGTLPFNFEAGLEFSDKKGLWLKAPRNTFVLNWRKLPGTLQIDELKVVDADLPRFPELGQSPPPEPSAPFGIGDFKKILSQAGDFLSEKPWWLPQVCFDGIGLNNFLLPEGLLPQKDNKARLRVDANLKASLVDGRFLTDLQIKSANMTHEPVDLNQLALDGVSARVMLDGGVENSALKAASSLKINIGNPVLAVNGLPANFLGEEINLDLGLTALAESNSSDPSLKVNLSGPNLDAGDLKIKGNVSWQSGQGWLRDQLDGPLEFSLNTTAAANRNIADSPLNMIRAPVNFALSAKGDLPVLALALDLDCPHLEIDKHQIRELNFSIKSEEIDLPLSEEALKALENENRLHLNVAAFVNKEKCNLEGELFFQAADSDRKTDVSSDTEKIWRAGLRNLQLEAFKIFCGGEVAAILLPGSKMPPLDGSLKLNVNNWKGIEAFIPGQKLSGKVDLDIAFESGLSNNPGKKLEGALSQNISANILQKAIVAFKSSSLAMQPKNGGDGFAVSQLDLQANASDIFGDLKVKAAFNADRIQAAGLNIDAKAEIDGPINGPLKANVQTGGDVKSSLAASWQPGKVQIGKLDVSMNSAKFISGGKKNSFPGLSLSRPAEALYGEKGFSVSGLDLKITPSGRLRASGGLSPEKFDFSLSLENLLFKPWHDLIPALPTGSAAVNLKLSGNPKRPAGNFRAELKQIKIPGVNLAPVSMIIDGGLKNSGNNSVFDVKLEVDPSTLKSLGADVAQVSAAIPLRFNDDGIPSLDKNGKLAARARWDGALGPIWNLVPVADQRLNGRIAINLDAAGTIDTPRIRGGVNIERARYENLLLGVLLTDISLRCDLNDKGGVRKVAHASLPGSMTLSASISDGHKGSVKINGNGDLDGRNLDIKINIDRLKPLRRRDIHVEFSGDLSVSGEAVSPDVAGRIVVNKGEALLDNIAMSGSVTTLDITSATKEKKEPGKNSQIAARQSARQQTSRVGNLDISMRMLPRFRVDGRGLGSIWEANLLVRGSLNNPEVTGTINAVSGNFDFLGKIFELSKGVVTFAGGSLANPLLNMELTNETPDLTAHILVTGPVNKMRLVLTSEPVIPRDEIISRVLFGKSINDLSRLEALQLAAAVAQLAGFGGGGGILNFTKKALGIDVLRVGTSSSGAAGEDNGGAGGTTIEAGKYITDKLYMGVQQGMKADSTAFIIQFELTPHTSLELRSEQNNTWGGLNWKYNY